MKIKYLLAVLLLCMFTSSLLAQTFITNVTIVDSEKQKLISNQTVVITDDLISNIQKNNKIKIPENATIIDGTDKYLIPGLIDAHIHFFQNGGLYTRPDAIDLRKFKNYEKDIAYAKTDMETKLRRYLQGPASERTQPFLPAATQASERPHKEAA